MDRLEKAIVRRGNPSQYDQSLYGSVCKSMEADGLRYELFLQLNQNENNPRWQSIGHYDNNTPIENILSDINTYLPTDPLSVR